MIDNSSIFLTTAAIVFIIWRATMLNRKLPWFPPVSKDRQAGPSQSRPWQQSPGRDVVPVWRR